MILVACAALTCVLTVSAFTAAAFTPEGGLVRSIYPQIGFAGTPIEDRTSEISLAFLDARPDFPRRFFSVRWRGFLFLRRAESVEFFAGGDDQVELHLDGQLLLRRSPSEGMGTRSRVVALEAGAHPISIEYQQFGGGMSLNIQRALTGRTPGPFLTTELFQQPVTTWQATLSTIAQWLNRIVPIAWIGLTLLLALLLVPSAISKWRTTGAPPSVRAYAHRIWLVAAPGLLGPVVVFLLGPHTIFTSNRGEFAVPFGELAMPWLMRPVVINWLILFVAGCVFAMLSERLVRIYSALLLTFGLLLWGQGHLWNPDYGVLAGRELNLEEHGWRVPYELAGWAAILLLGVIRYQSLSRIAPFASLVFLVVQAGAAVLTNIEPAEAQRPRWIEPPRAIYQFSSKQNVIHIVLDEFQSDVFTEMLERDRTALEGSFSGFTYFVDHAGSFPTTSFAMPAMLTGLEYRNQQPASAFVREAFKQASLFEKLSRAGYAIDAMSIVPLGSFEEWLGPEDSPNWRGARFRIRKPFVSQDDYREVSAGQLLELSLFRHVPHPVKAAMTTGANQLYSVLWMDRPVSPAQVRRHEASNSAAFLEHFTRMMSVGRDQPAYKLLHVGIPHRPIVVDRECVFIGVVEISREAFVDQSRCAIKLVSALLERARALGIYDSSLIIVSSDHGTDLEPLGFDGISESLSLAPGPAVPRLTAIAGTAKALMLIKPPNRTGSLTISEAPTTHADFQSTIVDILGLRDGTPDASMFRRDTKRRARLYGMYDFRQRFPKDYLDRLDVMEIEHRIVDADGWKFQRSIWRRDLALDSREVDFGPRPGNNYLGPGWSLEQVDRGGADRVTYVEAVTPQAVLFASLPAQSVEVVLRAVLHARPPGGPVAISAEVDGRPVVRLSSSGTESYRDMTIQVPADASRPTISHITLTFEPADRSRFVFKLDRLLIRR